MGLGIDSAVSRAKDPSSPTAGFAADIEAVPDDQRPQAAAARTALPNEHECVPEDVAPRQPYQEPRVKLTKDKRGQWILAPDSHLVNNLSWAVGFMELANAGDFAANVWNDIPIPIYAVVFMAIGGAVAGIMSIFAFQDARRACHNVWYLRQQRKTLFEEKRERELVCAATLDLDVILAINFRELGTELISRCIMDLLMGFGAILICTGTYLAIGGAIPSVYLASNLLSGYVGNTPIAIFGLFNFSWAIFIFCKAQSHVTESRRLLGPCTAVTLVKRRARRVQVFSIINGTAAILGGVASMITATRWWGYVILIPVIVSSIFCNIWWRNMIGYTRSEGHTPIECHELIHALELAAAAELSSSGDVEAVRQWCPELPNSLADMLSLLSCHSLFHLFCLAVVANQDLYQALISHRTIDSDDLTLTTSDIRALPETWQSTLMDIAKTLVRDVRPAHFKNRERYLAELLGTYCTMARQNDIEKEDDGASPPLHAEETEKM
ncbi:hypothetical protein E4U57_007530 [Claviceps arundinis]|uniref:Integral membrane protein n=1 Tax=Claviceps arundinis TaxID=1623583 RepID=A0ABQ7PIS2_9HYPO|nr:hypothetical protein E4U57_007530 [Claviceps arundinis]